MVVGQFGVSEACAVTEPSAVAPDARVNFRSKQVPALRAVPRSLE